MAKSNVAFSKAQVLLGTRPGYVQLAFGEKPGPSVIEQLKDAGFRWNMATKVWWGRAEKAASWGIVLPKDDRKPEGPKGRDRRSERKGKGKGGDDRVVTYEDTDAVSVGFGKLEASIGKLTEAMLGLNAKVNSIAERVEALESDE